MTSVVDYGALIKRSEHFRTSGRSLFEVVAASVADKWSNYRKGVSTVVVKGTSTSDVFLLLKTGYDHMLKWKT
jgi:hypothetical protein